MLIIKIDPCTEENKYLLFNYLLIISTNIINAIKYKTRIIYNYIYCSVNIGSYCGALASLKASELGSIVIKESLIRAGLKGSDVSEVIMGQVFIILEEVNGASHCTIRFTYV